MCTSINLYKKMGENSEQPCVTCKDECVFDCILCDECENWTHFKCMTISEYETELLHGTSIQHFYCSKCCSDDHGQFDFWKSLNRLSEAGRDSIEKMNSIALIEKIMMKQLPINYFVEENSDYAEKNIDEDNCKLLERFRTFKHVALHATSDGNCLFNSLSILLFGNEKNSLALRVQTCIYMALHKEDILENIPNEILLISSNFDDSLIKCSRNNCWSDCISIFAAASAFSVNIRMIYPPINGLTDLNIEILNKTLIPLGEIDSPIRTVMIMWTGGFSKEFNYEGDIWTPNHFVPVILKSNIKHLQTVNFSCSSNNFEIFSPKDDKALQKNDGIDSKKSLSVNEESRESPTINCRKENGSNKITLLPGCTGNNGNFLESDEVINILINHVDPLPEIPLGKKKNCYFIVCNKRNVERKGRNLDCRFSDDCGSWTQSSSKVVHYLIDVNAESKTVTYKYIENKSGQFYILKNKDRILMDPQPKQNEVLVLKRRYDKLASDHDFQRRISFFENGNIAIFEYKTSVPTSTSGLAPLKDVSKNLHDEYASTKGAGLERNKVKTKKIISMKGIKCDLAVDELQKLMMMLSTECHPFIKEIHLSSGSAPNLILYTDFQIECLKSLLQKDETSIVSVDRTIKVGPVYITLLVYSASNLICRKTQTSPVFVGPIFLHWNCNYQTYMKFFMTLKSVFSQIDCFEFGGENIGFGTTEEEALKNAVFACFPDSTQILCSRYLKENFKRFLRDKIHFDNEDLSKLDKDILQLSDLANETSIEERIKQIQSRYQGRFGQSILYFENFIENYKKYVLFPSIEKKFTKDWTNKSCKSLNHILKQSINWKTLQISDLIERLHEIINLQEKDFKRAIYEESHYLSNDIKIKIAKTINQKTHSFNKKKALQALRVAKPENQASNTPQTKRPLESSADALEHAKQLLKSGAIKLNNENKDKQSFKRSKNFEKKLKDPDKTPSAVGFQPFSAAHPDSLEKEKEDEREVSTTPNKVTKPRRKTLSESFVSEGSIRESKDNSDGEQQQPPPYKRPRMSGFDRDREDRRDNPKKGNTIYVHGHGVTEDLLRKAFSTFGTIVNITMELDRNCGFVSFEKMESAEQAISDVNGSIISDVQLKVSLARKQPSFNQPHDQLPSWGAIAVSSQSTSNVKDKREMIIYDDIFS